MSDPATAALIAAAYQHAGAHPALAAAVAEHQRVRAALSRILEDEGRWVHGHKGRMPLTEKEAGILRTLAVHAGRPVAKVELWRHVWPRVTRTFNVSHTLETHMYRLRQKMRDVGARASIVLDQKAGYRLAPLSEIPGSGGEHSKAA